MLYLFDLSLNRVSHLPDILYPEMKLPLEVILYLVACYATLHPALSVGPSVGRSVRNKVVLNAFF